MAAKKTKPSRGTTGKARGGTAAGRSGTALGKKRSVIASASEGARRKNGANGTRGNGANGTRSNGARANGANGARVNGMREGRGARGGATTNTAITRQSALPRAEMTPRDMSASRMMRTDAMNASSRQPRSNNPKADDLRTNWDEPDGAVLTTNQGLRIENDHDSLKVGDRGPTLLEDFHFREKLTHFDHERIPERVVHARGSGAHGYFQVYESLAELTKARFLCDPTIRTPVFVRFSTVVGSRGSTDMPRDVRGFATKFYTDEGVFDLVGNNMPVFFIQDALKFPDLIHAAKPEQDSEIPQAATAHDTFWDFISLMPESMHMIMWLMSDRAIPRSFRMMEGFGVHTFRLVNEDGEARFVKFHWKPLLGVHSVLWDEAQKISGKDPDFLRRDLWEAIESGHPPQWELGLQIVDEKDEHAFDFDLLDATKIIPEELVPVRRVGRLTLDRNPENFFAETEQVAFHPGHVVPGIDFSDDPLLQGRLFSYLDTQITRLGGPNFHQIPINRSVCPVHNHQREGLHQHAIHRGKVAYEPNTMAGGCPMQAAMRSGGFVSFPQSVASAPKVRARADKFFDHFSQARLFFNSQSEPEKEHLIEALRFELGKVQRVAIRERMVAMLAQVDRTLCTRVAEGLGVSPSIEIALPINHSVGADGDVDERQPRTVDGKLNRSEPLSMANTVKDSVETRKVAVLVADGYDEVAVRTLRLVLAEHGAQALIVAPRLGHLAGDEGSELLVDFSLLTASSVLFDAVFVPGGEESVETLLQDRDAVELIVEAYRHCKTIGASGAGVRLLRACPGLEALREGEMGKNPALLGIVAPDVAREEDAGDGEDVDVQLVMRFLEMLARHRHFERVGRNRTVVGRDRDETRGRDARV